jgi:hypothetical protein
MAFLAPALLAGLAALAIPILVHLVQRERKRVVAFPSLMFLRKIPYQSVRRRAIRHWLLLALRLAALALVVLAFARPIARGVPLGAGAAGGAREVVVLVDRSYSMGYGDHWARAQAAARRVVGALAPGDRATLAWFDEGVEVALRSATDPAALAAAVDRARPGAGATRYTPALKAAAAALEASDRPRREVVLVSDFQARGWTPSEDARLADGIVLTPVSVAEPGAANVAVTGVAIAREGFAGGERVTVSASLVSYGAAAVTGRDVHLEVDGRRLATARVAIEPGAAAVATFAPFTLGARAAQVVVRTAPDALPIDDAFYAVVAPAGRVKVLVIESADADAAASLYLRRALGVGGTPAFDVRTVTPGRAATGDLAEADVVALVDARLSEGPLARELERRVQQGAGLLVVLGERSAWPERGDLLPGPLGPTVDHPNARGGTLGFVDYSHPVFALFAAPRSGDLTAARVFRYRRLEGPGGVRARFDDGGSALVERRVGRGTVLVWTSTFDAVWNDLVLKPVFVPFIHQAMKYLAHYVEPRAFVRVGEALDVAAAAGALRVRPEELVIVTPGGRRVPLGSGEASGPFVFTEPGFYQVRAARREAAEGLVFAVNVDPGEADLATVDLQEFVAATAGRPGPTAPPGAGGEVPLAELERRQALWRYLVLGGLLVLVAETVVANRLPRLSS